MTQYHESDLDRLGRAGAVDAIRGFLRDAGGGHVTAPPRVTVPVGDRTLVFTIGGSTAGDFAGFRLYSVANEAGTHPHSQMLGLLRLSTGEVLATARGSAFGAWRTAALGAVAMDEATRHVERPLEVAILGTGFQAFHHARTWAATRPIAAFRVWGRRAEAATAFAAALARDTGIEARGVASAEDAVQKADAVLGVTRSPEPVVDAAALPAEGYVASVGPKFGGRNELPDGVYAGAAALFSDTPAQCAKFEREVGPLPGGRTTDEIVALANVVAGEATLPTEGRVLFVSEGLSGSEVALLAALHASGGGRGNEA